MPGQVDICNRALSIVGTRSTIVSMTEASNEAQQCLIHYEPVLEGLLRLHLWSFARKQMTLALICSAWGTPENPSSTLPIPLLPWQYEYTYPPDCVRVRSIYLDPVLASAGAQPVAFALSSDTDLSGNMIRVVLTNQSQAIVIYTARVTDPNMWDAEFQEAFVYLMASRLCGPLTGDKGLTQTYLQAAQQSILQARLTDGTETPTSAEHIPDWIQTRGFSSDGGIGGIDTSLLNTLLES